MRTTSATAVIWEMALDLGAFPTNGIPTDVTGATWSFEAPVLSASGEVPGDTVVAGTPVVFDYCAQRPLRPTTLPLVAGEGVAVLTAGSQELATPLPLPLDMPTALEGPLVAEVLVRPTGQGNPPRTVQVALVVDGVTVATGGTSELRLSAGTDWTSVPIDLGDVAVALPSGTTVDVEVTLARLELQLGGSSSVTLPVR